MQTGSRDVMCETHSRSFRGKELRKDTMYRWEKKSSELTSWSCPVWMLSGVVQEQGKSSSTHFQTYSCCPLKGSSNCATAVYTKDRCEEFKSSQSTDLHSAFKFRNNVFKCMSETYQIPISSSLHTIHTILCQLVHFSVHFLPFIYCDKWNTLGSGLVIIPSECHIELGFI